METTQTTSAPVSTPASEPTQAPASSPQAAVSMSTGDSVGVDSLRDELRGAFEKRFGKPDDSGSNAPVPDGLVFNGTQNSAQEVQQPPIQQPKEEQSTVSSTQDQIKQAEGSSAPQKIVLPKLGELPVSEVEQAVEGFRYYHSKVMQIQEDFGKLQSYSDNLKTQAAEVETVKQAPEFMLADAILKSDGFRGRIMALLNSPEGAQLLSDYKAAQQSQVQSQQKSETDKRIEALEAERVERTKAEQTAKVKSIVQTVDSQVSSRVNNLKSQGIEITQDDLMGITLLVQNLVQSGKMPFEEAALSKFYEDKIMGLAGRIKQARQIGASQKLEEKRSLPPAPPTGGAPQTMGPKPVSNFKEMGQIMAERLKMAFPEG